MKKIQSVIICFLIITGICCPVFARRSARDKACMSNIRVIEGAVEMYNMDNSTMMEELNPTTLDLLVKEKYIKGDRIKYGTEPGRCEYKSTGNLTEAGIIFCKYHGDLQHMIYSEYYKDDPYDRYEKLPQNANDDDIKKYRDKIAIDRERAIKRADFEKKVFTYIKYTCCLVFIVLTLWLLIPIKNPKKSITRI